MAADSFIKRLLRRSRIDEPTHGGDAIGWEASPFCVFSDSCLIGGKVDAVNLVACDIALQPLNLRTHFAENGNGPSRDFL